MKLVAPKLTAPWSPAESLNLMHHHYSASSLHSVGPCNCSKGIIATSVQLCTALFTIFNNEIQSSSAPKVNKFYFLTWPSCGSTCWPSIMHHFSKSDYFICEQFISIFNHFM